MPHRNDKVERATRASWPKNSSTPEPGPPRPSATKPRRPGPSISTTIGRSSPPEASRQQHAFPLASRRSCPHTTRPPHVGLHAPKRLRFGPQPSGVEVYPPVCDPGSATVANAPACPVAPSPDNRCNSSAGCAAGECGVDRGDYRIQSAIIEPYLLFG